MERSSLPTEPRSPEPFAPVYVTLLELVSAVTEAARNEEEVVATVLYMLKNGRARLCGNFEGAALETFTH